MAEVKEIEFVPSKACMNLFERYCNIKDEQLIRERVINARNTALKTFEYVCLKVFSFTDPKTHNHPYYPKLLKENNPDRKVLDLGCCVGTDLRSFLVDGVAKVGNIKGFELEKAFVDVGYEMFGDIDRLPEETFVIGDSLKEEGLPFPGNFFDVVYCGAVYHLLNEEQGIRLTQNVFKALKSKSQDGGDGVYFGITGGSKEAQPIHVPDERNGRVRYLHTPETFKKMFEDAGFKDVEVLTLDIDFSRGRTGLSEPQRRVIAFTAFKY